MLKESYGSVVQVHRAFNAVIQDLGRVGYEHVGVARGGAADVFSMRAANILVGNPPGAPLIEVTDSAFEFRAETPTTIAVTGARSRVLLDSDVQVPQWESVAVPGGVIVSIEPPVHGYRIYIAFSGGLRAERLLGSVSPLPPEGFRQDAEAGSLLRTGQAARPPLPRGARRILGSLPTQLVEAETVRMMQSSQADFFDHMDRLCSEPFIMSHRSNAVGARFTGTTPVRSDSREIMSRSVPIGSIEIPASGELIVLLRNRLITAGYPVPAVIARSDIDAVAQLRPGTEIRFQPIDEAASRQLLFAQETALDHLASHTGQI